MESTLSTGGLSGNWPLISEVLNANSGLSGAQTATATCNLSSSFWNGNIATFKLTAPGSAAPPAFRAIVPADLPSGIATGNAAIRSHTHDTGKTAAIGTATLCAASSTACGAAGQYHVHWAFTETGTACATPGAGGATFLLTWVDTNGTTHSATSLPMEDSSSLTATSGTFAFKSSLASAWASGDFNISTNGSVVQYATGYTGCTSGTGTYQLDTAVTQLQ